GDVKTPEDALRMVRETGCDGVMVGRGSFGNPWLFARAHRLLNGEDPGPEPTPRERIATAIGHLHDLAAKKGDYAAVLMRKHVAWYVRGLYDNSSLCRQLNHAASPAEVESLLLEYLERVEGAPGDHPPALRSRRRGHRGPPSRDPPIPSRSDPLSGKNQDAVRLDRALHRVAERAAPRDPRERGAGASARGGIPGRGNLERGGADGHRGRGRNAEKRRFRTRGGSRTKARRAGGPALPGTEARTRAGRERRDVGPSRGGGGRGDPRIHGRVRGPGVRCGSRGDPPSAEARPRAPASHRDRRGGRYGGGARERGRGHHRP